MLRSVAGPFTPQTSSFTPPSFTTTPLLPLPPIPHLDLYSPRFTSPRGEKTHGTSIARVTAPIMQPAAATARPDSTKNHLSSVSRPANSSRRKEPETDPPGGGRAKREEAWRLKHEGDSEGTRRVVHPHCACTLEIRSWRISTSAATK